MDVNREFHARLLGQFTVGGSHAEIIMNAVNAYAVGAEARTKVIPVTKRTSSIISKNGCTDAIKQSQAATCLQASKALQSDVMCCALTVTFASIQTVI